MALLFGVVLLNASGKVRADGAPVITPPPVTGAFNATFVEDRDHISVIAFSGNYDKDLSNGALNSEARAVVAQEFYNSHPDNYDFLVVFSTFEFNTGDALAFHLGVQNAVQGIGLPTFNNASAFGSGGKLQGYIDMAALTRYNLDPLQPAFETVLSTLSHEILHQWAARVRFKLPDGSLSEALLGKDNSHWSYLLDSDASVEYGSQWRDNGDGTFTSIAIRKFFSPLDLYLMGMYAPSEVPPFFVIDNPTIDKTQLPEENVTISGTKTPVTIQDIIAAEGPRVPSADVAQKQFRLGFVLLAGPGEAISNAQIGQLNLVRNAYMTRFTIMTGGRGIAEVFPEALPVEQVGAPGTIGGDGPRTVPTSIDEGLAWLRGQQDAAGFWQDKAATRMRDTAVTLDIVSRIDPLFTGANTASQWLSEQSDANTDDLARHALVLKNLGGNGSVLRATLITRQNIDGGWGLAQAFDSDPLDTALVLLALVGQGDVTQSVIDRGAQYLLDQQNSDGGWGNANNSPSRTSVTTTVLEALETVGREGSVAASALAWLVGKQNADGGFGDSPSTPYDTASVLDTFVRFDTLSQIQLDTALSYLNSQQSAEGSWNGSTYATALVVSTLKGFAVTNWVMDPTIGVEPNPPNDGERVKLSITLRNDSNVFAPQGVLRVFDGDPDSGGVPIGADIVVPVMAPNTALVFTPLWDSFDKPGTHTLVAVVDPDGVAPELSENDNRASVQIDVQPAPPGVDMSVVDTDIAVLPANPNILPTTLGFAISIRNLGLTDANNVRVVLWKGGINTGAIVDEVTFSVPGRSSLVANFTDVLTTAGTTVYTVQIDPDNLISEASEINNTASVNVETDPSVDLEVLASDISLDKTPAVFGDDVTFKVTLRNRGTLDSPTTQVRYVVTNGVESRDLGTNTIQIGSGSSIEQNILWRVDLTGDLTFTVQLDPDDLVVEIDETNNLISHSFTPLIANGPNLLTSFQDLLFNPPIGNEGFAVTLSAVVRNNGNQTANNIEVAFYDGDPALGGSQIGTTQVIPSLDPNGSTTVSILWDPIPDASDRLIFVVVDPNNTIIEFSDADNTAFNVLQVLSLPDLATSSGDIVLTPPFPVAGDTLTVNVRVTNLGQQTASNVLVRAFDGDPALGGVQIGEQTIASLLGGDFTQLSFSLSIAANSVAHPVVIQIDPNNAILERVRSNNIASRDIAVQDGDFFVSERFFSPDGDGNKDQTQLFFRMAIATNVTVEVVNVRNDVVRTFTGTDLNNITEGSIVWEGLDDLGRLVSDGDYRFRVIDGNGLSLGEVTVNLDTNRSSLLKALNTKFELFTNLTCELHQPENLQFTADDQRVFFLIRSAQTLNKGIYNMAGNGTDIRTVIPEGFFGPSGAPFDMVINDDGSKLAFIIFDSSKPPAERFSFWMANGDGSNLQQLVLPTDRTYTSLAMTPSGDKVYVWNFRSILSIATTAGASASTLYDSPFSFGNSSDPLLSPDGKHFVFTTRETSPHELRILNIETGQLVVPLGSGAGSFQRIQYTWSPDSKKLAVIDQGSGDISVLSTAGVLLNLFKINKNDFIDFEEPVWSSTSTEIAFSVADFGDLGADPQNSGIYVADTLTGSLEKIAAFSVTEFSYHIATWDGSDWVERGVLRYGRFYSERQLDLSDHLPDADGEYKVRINQVGHEAAHVEDVALLAGNLRLFPTQAIDASGLDVLQQIRYPDFEILDLHESNMVVKWKDVPPGRALQLALRAREESISKLNTLPFSYPVKEGDAYQYVVKAGNPMVVDGVVTPQDNLSTPLFKQFSRPDTGHPPGIVYGYVSSDEQYLYGALDFTVDNTVDGDRDWGSLRVKTAKGWQEFKVTAKDNQYGVVSFTKTPVISYPHQYYEFKVPLSEINAAVGDTVEIAFQAYGTAAIIIGDDDLPAFGSIIWATGERSFIYDAEFGGQWVFLLDEDNRREQIFEDWPGSFRKLKFSPSGRKLLFLSNRAANDPTSVCFQQGFEDQWTFESLLNLVADLRAIRSDRVGGILLSGTAADLNFDHYLLEFTPISDENAWQIIAPASSVPVIDDVFTTWVPPGIGTFFIRLSVFDKAGNSRQTIKRVSWGNTTSITNLFRTPEFISPNGDGVQDSVSLHYRVLEPVHLEFNITNASGDLVRTLTRDHSLIGTEHDLVWDGRDESGLPVADGDYRITVQDFEFFVTVDSTVPQVLLTLNNAKQLVTEIVFGIQETKYKSAPSLSWQITEQNDYNIVIETGVGASPVNWIRLDEQGAVDEGQYDLSLAQFTNHNFRLVVTDVAGNVSTITTGLGAEEIFVVDLSNSRSKLLSDLNPADYSIAESIRLALAQVSMQYRKSSSDPLNEDLILQAPVPEHGFSFKWTPTGAALGDNFIVRIRALDVNGQEYLGEEFTLTYSKSDVVSLTPGFDPLGPNDEIGGTDYDVFLVGSKPLVIETITLESSNDPRFVIPKVLEFFYNSTQFDGSPNPDPQGEVNVVDAIAPGLRGCKSYTATFTGQVIGVDASTGQTTLSPLELPPVIIATPCLEINTEIHPPVTQTCGVQPPQQVAFTFRPTALNEIDLTLLTLASIDAANNESVVFNINKPESRKDYQFDLDISGLAEGVYPYVSRLINDANDSIEERPHLFVDRTPPSASFTNIQEGQRLCAIPRVNSNGDIENVLPIEVLLDDVPVPGIENFPDAKDILDFSATYTQGQSPIIINAPLTGEAISFKESKENKDRFAGTLAELINPHGDYTFQLEATDAGGFKQCVARSFFVDGQVNVQALNIENALFSPNGDGLFDEVIINFTVEEAVFLDVDVFTTVLTKRGHAVTGTSLRSIVNQLQVLPGTSQTTWDGRNDSGVVVPDGTYGIVVTYTDGCGNKKIQTRFVTVDNTAPTAFISYPNPGDPIPMIIEVLGTVSDTHLLSYRLEFGAGDAPDTFSRV